MTILGKLLAFLVMLLALAGAWFIANGYAARVNWKTRADESQAQLKAAVQDFRDYVPKAQSEIETLRREVDSRQKKLEAAEAQVRILAFANDLDRDALDKAVADFNKKHIQVKELQATLDQNAQELKGVRDRIGKLEAERVQLTIAREQAERDRLAARNEADLNKQIAEDFARRVEDLTTKINELRAAGIDPRQQVLKAIDRSAPPVPENFRGTITAVSGDFVELSLGIDAGLAEGSVLDLLRIDGGGKYLGTVRVTRVVEPKRSVAVFRPAGGKTMAQLRPDERPRVGDRVEPNVTRNPNP